MRSKTHHTPIKFSFYELRDVKKICLKILNDCKVAEELSRAAKLKPRKIDEPSSILENAIEVDADLSMIKNCDGYHIDQTLPSIAGNHFLEKWCQEIVALQVSLADDDNAASADSTSDYYSSISESKTSLDKAVSNADLRATSVINAAIKFVPCGSTRISNITCSTTNCCCFHLNNDVNSEDSSKPFSMIPLQGLSFYRNQVCNPFHCAFLLFSSYLILEFVYFFFIELKHFSNFARKFPVVFSVSDGNHSL